MFVTRIERSLPPSEGIPMLSSRKTFIALAFFGFVASMTVGCGGTASKSFSNATVAPAPAPAPPPTSTPVTNGITVTSPANGASVGSPFNVSASATGCSSAAVSSIGYSLDGSTDYSVVSGASIQTQVPASSGTHVLHVKAWNGDGASCGSDVTFAVSNASSPEKSLIPANAVTVSAIQNSAAWIADHDPRAGKSSAGSMTMVSSPSLSGHARRFDTHFTNFGGEIYDASFGNDPDATNFFYDGWVYLTDSVSNMANIEMDTNQVLDNGNTVIYGFQCDGNSSTWDYTANRGTPTKPIDVWVHTSAYCNARNWGKNTWHHIQISYSRDDSGNVTYHSVWLDGYQSSIEATVYSTFALDWTQALVTNFQVDGIGTGSNTVYLDKLNISRW